MALKLKQLNENKTAQTNFLFIRYLEPVLSATVRDREVTTILHFSNLNKTFVTDFYGKNLILTRLEKLTVFTLKEQEIFLQVKYVNL